jgi:hypothetical protein
VARLREVRERLGDMRYQVLVGVAEDRSWSELGRVMGRRDVTAKGKAVEAIEPLAEVC